MALLLGKCGHAIIGIACGVQCSIGDGECTGSVSACTGHVYTIAYVLVIDVHRIAVAIEGYIGHRMCAIAAKVAERQYAITGGGSRSPIGIVGRTGIAAIEVAGKQVTAIGWYHVHVKVINVWHLRAGICSNSNRVHTLFHTIGSEHKVLGISRLARKAVW